MPVFVAGPGALAAWWPRVGGGAGGGPVPRPHRDRLAAAVDGDRARRRRPLGPVGGADARSRGLSSGSGTPPNLENLARTYWRFLSRVTLGVDPRRLWRERALGGAARPAADAAALRRARVRARARPRHGQLADPGRPAGRPRRPRAAASFARRQRPATRADGRVEGPHRGRGRELLPGDRGRLQHAGLRGDPVARSTCWSRTRSCARWPRSTSRPRRSAALRGSRRTRWPDAGTRCTVRPRHPCTTPIRTANLGLI